MVVGDQSHASAALPPGSSSIPCSTDKVQICDYFIVILRAFNNFCIVHPSKPAILLDICA
jgi:hypothetical protein